MTTPEPQRGWHYIGDELRGFADPDKRDVRYTRIGRETFDPPARHVEVTFNPSMGEYTLVVDVNGERRSFLGLTTSVHYVWTDRPKPDALGMLDVDPAEYAKHMHEQIDILGAMLARLKEPSCCDDPGCLHSRIAAAFHDTARALARNSALFARTAQKLRDDKRRRAHLN